MADEQAPDKPKRKRSSGKATSKRARDEQQAVAANADKVRIMAARRRRAGR